MDNNIYLYIPREQILNFESRNHRGKNFRNLFYYKNKKRYKFNDKQINEVDIYNVKSMQIDTLYKSSFKSRKDKYFDWYYCLKPEYNDCESIYIEKNKGYSSKNKDLYIENRNKLKGKGFIDSGNSESRKTGKFIVTFD